MSEIKPVLRQMIDNNKPQCRPETIRGAHKQLDEYEAKAKAFDVIREYITDELRDMRRVAEDVPFAFSEEMEALGDVLDKMNEYERGDSE